MIFNEKDIQNTAKVAKDLLSKIGEFIESIELLNAQEREEKFEMYLRASDLLLKNINIFQKISKVEYAPEPEEKSSEPSLADLQIMARTLVSRGMVVLMPDVYEREHELIYRAAEILNKFNGVKISRICDINSVVTGYEEVVSALN